MSTRLTDAPSAVTTEGPVSLEMERLMSQMPDGMGEVKSQRVLELNAKHPVFQVLKDAQSAGDAEKVKLYTEILYDQALIVEGMPIADPGRLCERGHEADGLSGRLRHTARGPGARATRWPRAAVSNGAPRARCAAPTARHLPKAIPNVKPAGPQQGRQAFVL